MNSLANLAQGQLMSRQRPIQRPTFAGGGQSMYAPPTMSAGYGQIGAGDAGMPGKMPPPMQAGYGQIGAQDGGMHPIQQAGQMMMQNGVHPSFINPIMQAHGFQPLM